VGKPERRRPLGRPRLRWVDNIRMALLGATHILRVSRVRVKGHFNPLKAQLNPICYLLALLGAHHILHVSRIRVNYSSTPK